MDNTSIDYNYQYNNKQKRTSDISKKGSIQSDQTEFVSMYLNRDDLDSEIYQFPISENMIDETVDHTLDSEDDYLTPVSRVSRKKSLLSQRRSVQVNLFLDNFIIPSYDNEVVNYADKVASALSNRVINKQQNFNLMIIGDSGLGKRTFIENIRSAYGYSPIVCQSSQSNAGATEYNYLIRENSSKNIKLSPKPDEQSEELKIIEERLHLQVESRKLSLKLICVEKYGDLINHTPVFPIITSYVENKFKNYFQNECALNRASYDDERIHACIYFLSPFIQGLKSIDIKFLKSYQSKLNILLVIGRADCLNQSELANVKKSIMKDLERHRINLNPYLTDYELDEEESYEFGHLCDDLKSHMPFAVVSPLFEKKKNESPAPTSRKYSLNAAKNVKENEDNERKALETILFSTHLNFFKKLTNRYFYENFRSNYIMEKLTSD